MVATSRTLSVAEATFSKFSAHHVWKVCHGDDECHLRTHIDQLIQYIQFSLSQTSRLQTHQQEEYTQIRSVSDLWECGGWPISSLLLPPMALFNRGRQWVSVSSNIGTNLTAISRVKRFFALHSRLTSSLQLTVASPWSFMALQEYTPPSKFPGLRISREQIPWTQVCLYLGSSPIIIWFFSHWTLGWWKENGFGNTSVIVIISPINKLFLFVLLGKEKKTLDWKGHTAYSQCGSFNGTGMVRTPWGPDRECYTWHVTLLHYWPLTLMAYTPPLPRPLLQN